MASAEELHFAPASPEIGLHAGTQPTVSQRYNGGMDMARQRAGVHSRGEFIPSSLIQSASGWLQTPSAYRFRQKKFFIVQCECHSATPH
jgi:hypothetical protein